MISSDDGLLCQTQVTVPPSPPVRLGQALNGPGDGAVHVPAGQVPHVSAQGSAVLLLLGRVDEGVLVVAVTELEGVGCVPGVVPDTFRTGDCSSVNKALSLYIYIYGVFQNQPKIKTKYVPFLVSVLIL